MSPKQIVLRDPEIRIIIRRIALQIAENHTDHVELLLIGLNQRGYYLANLIKQELQDILPSLSLDLQSMDMANPTAEFSNTAAHILIVDDVLNSGKTAFLAASACMHNKLIKLETAFLAVREHRNFPVSANYVGLSIATTLQEHVLFDNDDETNLRVYLQ
jgi:pyrimidine operon attenuation protein/uracil phosphoribosyltransferase